MGSKQTTTVDMRALSLEEVIALQNQGGEIYQKVIKNTFPGRDFTEIRERFIKRRPVDREKSEKISREYMGVIQKCLNDQDEKMAELQRTVSKSYNRLVDAQNKFEAAQKSWKEHSRYMRMQKATLNRLIKRDRRSQRNMKQKKRSLMTAKFLSLFIQVQHSSSFSSTRLEYS